MSQELQTAVAALVAAIAGWFVSRFVGNKPAAPMSSPTEPGKPVEPVKPDDELQASSSHPFLRIIVPGLLRWLGLGDSTPAKASGVIAMNLEQTMAHDEAALTLIASAVRNDPQRLARMKALLGSGQ